MNDSTKVWKQKDGTLILIEDMTDSHLLNTINFLLRRAERIRLQWLCRMDDYIADMPPDGAADCCATEADYLAEMEPEEVLETCVPQWKALVAEAKKRGIPKHVSTAYRGPLMPRPAGLKR
jgi:hypothetical protein